MLALGTDGPFVQALVGVCVEALGGQQQPPVGGDDGSGQLLRTAMDMLTMQLDLPSSRHDGHQESAALDQQAGSMLASRAVACLASSSGSKDSKAALQSSLDALLRQCIATSPDAPPLPPSLLLPPAVSGPPAWPLLALWLGSFAGMRMLQHCGQEDVLGQCVAHVWQAAWDGQGPRPRATCRLVQQAAASRAGMQALASCGESVRHYCAIP